MADQAIEPVLAKDPAHDDAFEHLVRAWTDGSLGVDEHEGVGLLWKEGLISDLLITMLRRAPVTMRALGERLAEGSPAFADEKSYVPRRLISEFVQAMKLPAAARRERLDALDLPEPTQELSAALRELSPPMDRRFRTAIEAWVDTAVGIETRSKGQAVAAEPAVVVGSRVRHAQWGDGVVLAVTPGSRPLATVDFGELGQKKVLIDYLALAS